MEKILITGGAGFIGSHLCDHFLKRGYSVICMDNLITGDLCNIEHLFGEERFLFVKSDITNYIHVKGDLRYILHFASPASPVDYMKFPIQTLKVGALGTHKVLGLAREKGATVMLASTSEVYGDPLFHPQVETYWGNVNPVGPRGVYDEAKRFAESMITAYHRYHGIDVRIARIFNTYGPRMRLMDGRAIPNFIHQALRSESLTVYGDGKQTRSFCYIDDMVKGLEKLLFSNYTGPLNLGNPIEMSILELAEKIIETTRSSSRIEFRPLPKDDPRVRRPDISLAKRILEWKPTVSFDEGIGKTVDYFRKGMGG